MGFNNGYFAVIENYDSEELEDIDEAELKEIQRENALADYADYAYEDEKLN